MPQFSGIRIHAGNKVADTQGCILVGENMKPGEVWNSRKYVQLLMDKMQQALDLDEGIHITIE